MMNREDWKVEVNERLLDLHPVDDQPHLLHGAHLAGHPYRVVLEPGDATRYDLLFVPIRDAWRPDALDPHGDHVLVVSLNLAMRNTPPVVDLRWAPGPYDFSDTFTGYTAEILAAFCGLLVRHFKGGI